MRQSSDFTIDELLVEESFLNYYFMNNESDMAYWEIFLEENPAKKPLIDEAIRCLDRLSLKWNEEQIRRRYYELQEILEEETPSKSFFAPHKWALSAAASVAILLGFWWFYSINNATSAIYKELISEKKLIEKVNENEQPMLVTLEDGSSILLKKNSRLSFPEHFADEKREVYLDGEAFFEVAKDPSKPFYVFANELVTKVLGTSFLVKARRGEDMKVIVRTGKVSVFKLEDARNIPETKTLEGVVITPNQQIKFDPKHSNFSKSLVEEPELQAQLPSNDFEFKDVAASEVFSTIQKAYGVNIVYDEDILKKCPVTASLTDEPLYEKLDLVCRAIEADYQVIDGQIIISTKGCNP